MFLFYVLHERLRDKKPTILQTQGDEFVLFCDSGVWLIPTRINSFSLDVIIESGTFILFDNSSTPPQCFLDSNKVFFVAAASPRSFRVSWHKRVRGRVIWWTMKPWTVDELEDG